MLTPRDKIMIRHIVDGLHVSMSNEEVYKMWLARGKNCSEAVRNAAGKYAVEVHEENRKLYQFVMRGGF